MLRLFASAILLALFFAPTWAANVTTPDTSSTVGDIVEESGTAGVVVHDSGVSLGNVPTLSGNNTFTGTIGGSALSSYLASPPAIGTTAPGLGEFSGFGVGATPPAGAASIVDPGGVAVPTLFAETANATSYAVVGFNFVANQDYSSFGDDNTHFGFTVVGGKALQSDTATGSWQLFAARFTSYAAGDSNAFFTAGQERMAPQAPLVAANASAQYTGNNAVCDLPAGMTPTACVAEEADVLTASNVVNTRNGLRVVDIASTGSHASDDAGVQILRGTSAIGFSEAIYFGSALVAGELPVPSTGTLIGAASGTVAHGIDLSLLTCGTDCLKLPGFSVDGAGNADAASLVLTPPSGTTTQGISIAQTGPSGAASGPLQYNVVNVTSETPVSTGTFPNIPAFDSASFALNVNMTAGGSALTGKSIAGAYFLNITIPGTGGVPGGDKVGLGGYAYANVPIASGLFHGLQGSTLIDNGGSVADMEGAEVDSGVNTGGSATYRFGLAVGNIGSVQASTLDAALLFDGYFSGGGAFRKMIVLSNWAGYQPLSNTADLFYADTAYTVANIFNFPTMTVTGDILDFPNVQLTGSGQLNLKTVSGLAGGHLGFGTETNPQAPFVFGQNATSGNTVATLGLVLIGADGVGAGFSDVNYASLSGFTAYRADGTAASPTALASGDELSRMGSNGYNGSAFISGARISAKASQAWTGSVNGTYWEFDATPNASGTRAAAMFIQGGVNIGTTLNDPGSGNLQASGWLGTGIVAIGSLPSCSSTIEGARYLVSNGVSSPTFGSTASTTGSTVAPVTCNGSSWIYGYLLERDIAPDNDNVPAFLGRVG